MDDQRTGTDKMDEILLPGFRFHPTDEELVGFYLKRKVQQRPLPIELIKQLDIYKYNPWDLPKLAATGEKEWYFYCPRDRKYRNSTRPNRVTGAGFWKATGTDRPIYSSEGSKCIGLKKSLVFYKGRAAKGIKTEWMMHEFRLPSLTDHSAPQKRPFMDKTIPAANDSWAICRIFKKANSSTAQSAVSQYSWMPPVPETLTTSDILSQQGPLSSHQFTSSENIQFSSNHHHDLQQSCVTNFSPPFVPYKPLISISNEDLPTSLGSAFSSLQTPSPGPSKCAALDASSMSLNMSSTIFVDFGKNSESVGHFSGLQEQCDGFSVTLPQEMHANASLRGEETTLLGNLNGAHFEEQWGTMRSSTGIPFITSSPLIMADAWKSNLAWDSSTSPCPSDQTSTSYSANKCYN